MRGGNFKYFGVYYPLIQEGSFIIKISNAQSKAATQDKAEEREAWLKLVVKILSWKDGSCSNKVSSKEWKTYFDRTITINSTEKQKTLTRLAEIKATIQSRGGFAD